MREEPRICVQCEFEREEPRICVRREFKREEVGMPSEDELRDQRG